jgi:hypothetical protein
VIVLDTSQEGVDIPGFPLFFQFSATKKEAKHMMKTAQRHRRAKIRFRSNRSLLMLGIAILDCGLLILCIIVFVWAIRLFLGLTF